MTYLVLDESTFKETDKESELLANFNAQITQETRYLDGINSMSFLTIQGRTKDEEFEPITIQAEKFAAMAWVTPNWGVRAVMQPGQGIKEDLRTQIQLASQKAVKKTIYTCTGWTKVNSKWTYLHAGGGISETGNDPKISVQLPAELSRFNLPSVKLDKSLTSHIRCSLNLIHLGPHRIMWPLLAAAYRTAIGSCDYALHLAGKTGTFKTEISSLIQSHFGQDMDSRKLPGNWSSTANALEAQAFKLKNAIFVVDDFVPTGTGWQLRQLQKTADQLLRGQGNQAGRARLSDTSNLQTTMYPRGCILSSGEDVPEGHSIRARMFIIETTPGDISLEKLSAMQKCRPSFALSMAGFIRWLASSNLQEMRNVCGEMTGNWRDANLSVGHTRTPSTLGNLISGAFFFLQYAMLLKAIDQPERDFLFELATNSITDAANMQTTYLETADPVETFISTLQLMLASKMCHLRTRDGGIPENPEALGYEKKMLGNLPDFSPKGPLIGWVDDTIDELYLDASNAVELIKKAARGGLALTKQTMITRLKDAHLLKRRDTQRGRNTIRINCQSIPKTCIALSLSETLSTKEEDDAQKETDR